MFMAVAPQKQLSAFSSQLLAPKQIVHVKLCCSIRKRSARYQAIKSLFPARIIPGRAPYSLVHPLRVSVQ